MTARIVLTDDELHIRRAAEFKLKREFDVAIAEDGQEAWELIQQSRPDVVVTDIQMPRMNGIELVERIRACQDTADLPVILLTAKGFELSQDEAFGSLRVAALMSKPFSPRELCRQVQRVLNGDTDERTNREPEPVLL